MVPAEKPDPGAAADDVTRDSGAASKSAPPQTYLRLGSSGRRVTVMAARDFPIVSVLLGEDAYWQFSRTFWQARKPAWWRLRARPVWRAQGSELEVKRLRLVAMADEVLGPVPAPGTLVPPTRHRWYRSS